MRWAIGRRRGARGRATTGIRVRRITIRALVGVVAVGVMIGLVTSAALRTDDAVGVETASDVSTATVASAPPADIEEQRDQTVGDACSPADPRLRTAGCGDEDETVPEPDVESETTASPTTAATAPTAPASALSPAAAAPVPPRAEPAPVTGSVRICPDPESEWHETVSIADKDGVTLFSAPVESDPVVFDGVPAGDLWLHLNQESEPAPPSDGVDIGTATRIERHPITVNPGETIEFRC